MEIRKLNSQERRARILYFFEPASNSILSPLPSPFPCIQYSKRVKEREELFPHGLLFTPRFIHGVRKREAWDTRAGLVRRIGKHGQGRQARIEWNRTESNRMVWNRMSGEER